MNIVFLEADNLGEDMRFDRFFELGEVQVYTQTPEDKIAERVAQADAVLVNKLPMNESTLGGAEFVKYIGVTATGTNNIDYEYMKKRGIYSTELSTGASQERW